jgi:hypothetical protein
MSEKSKFDTIIDIKGDDLKSINMEILGRITRVIFFLFMPDGQPMSESDIDDLMDESFGLASLLMAVAGMRVAGENIDGDYVVKFKPYKSLEHFEKENESK